MAPPNRAWLEDPAAEISPALPAYRAIAGEQPPLPAASAYQASHSGAGRDTQRGRDGALDEMEEEDDGTEGDEEAVVERLLPAQRVCLPHCFVIEAGTLPVPWTRDCRLQFFTMVEDPFYKYRDGGVTDVPCCAVPCRAVPCRAVPCHAMPCPRNGVLDALLSFREHLSLITVM